MRHLVSATALLAAAALVASIAAAQQPASSTSKLSGAEIGQFLRTAQMGPRSAISVGVASTQWAPMNDGKTQHRGHIASIDLTKASFATDRGTEINFRDSWKFNRKS